MDGSQLVQWSSVQADNMAGDIQHNVRALMVKVSSPMPTPDGRDEVSSLRKQLGHQQQAHEEMQTMLKNQAWAIEISLSKWQWLVKKHMLLLSELVPSHRTLYEQNLPLFSDLKIVFNVNMMVNFDHVIIHYKRNVENMLYNRRIRCVRSSSIPSLKNPACITAASLKTSSLSGGACRC